MQNSIVICLFIITCLLACDNPGQKGSEPVKDPELLWIYEGLGRGYGGPCITREGIFVNAEDGGNSYTVCLEPDGTIRWKSPNGKEFVGVGFSSSYPGTRSAPTVSGGRVYAASGMGHVSCFDARNGKVIWKVDLIHDLGGIPGEFGYSESPTVDEQNVYCFRFLRLQYTRFVNPEGQRPIDRHFTEFHLCGGQARWHPAFQLPA
jgi:outer membrane protein assembly factor BamB